MINRSKVDKAGERLREGVDLDRISEDLEVLGEWRSLHSYPLKKFRDRLDRLSSNYTDDPIVAQRLKRVPSILKKLNRVYPGATKPTMKLSQMQDIAGCRTVLDTNEKVYALYNSHYKTNKDNVKHEKVNEKDYILTPKADGYRSIHLVYRYTSTGDSRKKYDGLLIEIQLRSRLQHIWATAVETVDIFTGQALKSNQGDKKWGEFFRLVSSAFALKEGTPIVKDTPSDKQELYAQIKALAEALNVVTRMTKWTESARSISDSIRRKDLYYYLLELDTIQEKLTTTAFTERSKEEAFKAYIQAEKKIFNRDEYDVVLVATDSFKELKQAYPNYFIDTKSFLNELKKIINE